ASLLGLPFFSLCLTLAQDLASAFAIRLNVRRSNICHRNVRERHPCAVTDSDRRSADQIAHLLERSHAMPSAVWILAEFIAVQVKDILHCEGQYSFVLQVLVASQSERARTDFSPETLEGLVGLSLRIDVHVEVLVEADARMAERAVPRMPAR